MGQDSQFDGSIIEYIGNILLLGLICIVTCYIAFPWGSCRFLRWKYSHTIINGQRLCFDGNGAELFGNYFIWQILTIVTCGIYGFIMPVKLMRWETEHTHFESPSGNYYGNAMQQPSVMQGNASANPINLNAAAPAPVRQEIPSVNAAIPDISGNMPAVQGNTPMRFMSPDPRDSVTQGFPVSKGKGVDSNSNAARQKQVQIFFNSNGQQKSYNLNIDGSLIVGRDQSSNLVLPDSQMSRQHFVLSVEGGDIFISDLDTTNGTFVNGNRLSSKCRLMSNSCIQAGRTQLIVKW